MLLGLERKAGPAAAYVAHALGIVLASQDRPARYAINFLVGAGWFFGALLHHLPDVIFPDPYRAGLPSKLLEVSILLFGLALVSA